MTSAKRSDPRRAGGAFAWIRRRGDWAIHLAVALACTEYLNVRGSLIPKWGKWYAGDYAPYTLLEIRALLSGHLALVPHPWLSERDYFWGRGGMHTAWGLGLPILGLPLHLVGRLFGAPGFPDCVRFLLFFGVTTILLCRALYRTSSAESGVAVSSGAAAGFVMVFPTFVALVASRFLIYDQTEATGALWDVALLAGVVALLARCTPARLLLVCAAAGFTGMIRVHLAAYGFTTAVLALIIADRKGLGRRTLLAGLGAYAVFAALYFAGNVVRFGGVLHTGYENCVCGPFPNHMTRWGLPFVKLPFWTQATEMFATLFLLGPVTQVEGPPPESIKAFTVGERFREYYAPTFDLPIFAIWVAAVVVVGVAVWRGKLWRRDRDLSDHVAVVIGAWAIPPSVALFVFLARLPFTVTRYATDLYPAMAAACLCVGMVLVRTVRARAPSMAGSAQLALAGAVALYIACWREGITHLSQSIDAKAVTAQIENTDKRSNETADLPKALACHEDRGRSPVHLQLWGWQGDCRFTSGMNFAMIHSPCLTFTFGGPWTKDDDVALSEFRVNADFDHMVGCGAPVAEEGDTRKVTMCDPQAPPFLLDGLRLYTVGALDDKLASNDRLKLLRIDPAKACH